MMMYHINDSSKEELQQIIKSVDIEEAKEIYHKMENLRGMEVLGVFLFPLHFRDFDNDNFREWCNGVEYERDDLIKVFAHFARKAFDGEFVTTKIEELHFYTVDTVEVK